LTDEARAGARWIRRDIRGRCRSRGITVTADPDDSSTSESVLTEIARRAEERRGDSDTSAKSHHARPVVRGTDANDTRAGLTVCRRSRTIPPPPKNAAQCAIRALVVSSRARLEDRQAVERHVQL
jgi:hypothetical protein